MLSLRLTWPGLAQLLQNASVNESGYSTESECVQIQRRLRASTNLPKLSFFGEGKPPALGPKVKARLFRHRTFTSSRALSCLSLPPPLLPPLPIPVGQNLQPLSTSSHTEWVVSHVIGVEAFGVSSARDSTARRKTEKSIDADFYHVSSSTQSKLHFKTAELIVRQELAFSPLFVDLGSRLCRS